MIGGANSKTEYGKKIAAKIIDAVPLMAPVKIHGLPGPGTSTGGEDFFLKKFGGETFLTTQLENRKISFIKKDIFKDQNYAMLGSQVT